MDKVRNQLENGFGDLDDAEDVVEAMIACGREQAPPLRLALGAVTYDYIETALQERLKSLHSQKDLAHSIS